MTDEQKAATDKIVEDAIAATLQGVEDRGGRRPQG